MPIADNLSTVYVLKRVGADAYRHADPLNGEWWGPLQGSFSFTSPEEAIKYGAYFTGGEAFQVQAVERPVKG